MDAEGKNGVTPLHVAVHYDNTSLAHLLLEKVSPSYVPYLYRGDVYLNFFYADMDSVFFCMRVRIKFINIGLKN